MSPVSSMSLVLISSSTSVSSLYTHSSMLSVNPPPDAGAFAFTTTAPAASGASPSQKNCWAAFMSMSLWRLVNGLKRPRMSKTCFLYRASCGILSSPDGVWYVCACCTCMCLLRMCYHVEFTMYAGICMCRYMYVNPQSSSYTLRQQQQQHHVVVPLGVNSTASHNCFSTSCSAATLLS